ncbi:MAG: gamma-glutamyltransferase [Planctomycetes bacterium]|nr:gamma-glutamyltransferase [Planctomycetota bacterium]
MLIRLLLSLAIIFACPTIDLLAQSTATGSHGMVASVHPLATDAGLAVLRSGGNAVDAAVATALTLGVVDGHNSGIGGGGLMLVRRADGTLVALDGREKAPAAATRDMFLRNGVADHDASQTGPLASGVPGALHLYYRAVRDYGRKKLADLLQPAAEIAERGFPIDEKYAAKLKANAKTLARFPASRAVLLKADGSPLATGDELRQPDLARTYRAIAAEGIDWFYRGEFARVTGDWMSANGGIMTAADFADYRCEQREPLVTRYRQYTIVGFPPPSAGGIVVAQTLQMLERFDLREIHRRDPAEHAHLLAEAMKLAYADRAYWLGDPAFTGVPRRLVDRAYTDARSQLIDPQRASSNIEHGTPPKFDDELFGRHTTHLTVVDAEGNWVALTATVNTAFGSKVIIPGTGVIMNNQMDDLSIQLGTPNAFGLFGAEANAVAPGKRPLSSMSPTIVLRDGQPVLTVGAAGGPKISTQVILALTNRLDLQMSLAEALAAPRLHHQWRPDEVWVEQGYPASLAEALAKRGHKIHRAAPTGASQAIERTPEGVFIGVSDPRVPGKAAGW